MAVRQESKHEVIATLRGRYRAAGRVEKGRLSAEVVLVTGYHARYAQTLLREGVPYRGPRLRRGGRPPTYGPEVVRALTVAAEATGWICGKRLAAALPEVIPALEREGALVLSDDLRTTVCALSAATIDRRLAAARRQQRPRGLSTTKPGSLLKSQVPIRTYTPWDEEEPGFLEIDLVAHCGTTTAGEYVHTLDATDIATGWTECAAVANKSQLSVLAALQTLRERVPFPLRGIDSSIQTTGASFSMRTSYATARRNTSPSRAAGRPIRTTRPTSSRRTGAWSASSSATTATRGRRRSRSSTVSTLSSIRISMAICPR